MYAAALSKRPSEGSLNVLRVSHDAFEATLIKYWHEVEIL